MPELRKDPVVGRWVIISVERGKRPTDFAAPPEEPTSDFCPFCYDSEDKTPSEVFAIRPDNSPKDKPGWTLRIIPNKYPALRTEGQMSRQADGFYDKMNGVGIHEVIIETHQHEINFSHLDLTAIRDTFWAIRERIREIKKDRRLKYAMVFKNRGLNAGASLAHSHSQLIAMPVIPKRVIDELEGAQNYFRQKERCIFCDIIHQEKKESVRLVLDDEYFEVIEPYAPRFPFETWILPKQHISHFEETADEVLENLAATMKDFLKRINRALTTPPFTMVLHTSPLQEAALDHYHWHLEFMPRLTRVAGFEGGTGFYINPTSPEDAAQYLRELNV